MSSQLVTIPCSMGYFRERIPRFDCASSPTYESFCPIPTITPWWRGRPTIEGKTARGASSPAKPALHIPDPLSTTNAVTSASHIFLLLAGETYLKSEAQMSVLNLPVNSILFMSSNTVYPFVTWYHLQRSIELAIWLKFSFHAKFPKPSNIIDLLQVVARIFEI